VAIDGEQAAQSVLPLGNTDPERVVQAAIGVAELVRRLNHATHPTGSGTALPWPSSVGRVAGQIDAALWGIEQLLGQLAHRLDAFADHPRLYHDQRRDDREAAATAARHAAA
jgi:hypothetical protein